MGCIALGCSLWHVETIRILLDSGADPDLRDCNGNHWTPLLHAVHMRQEEAARALMEDGADINFCSTSGLTALTMAAGYGQTELVKELLEQGADPSAETEHGTNALWAAAGGGAIRDFTDGPPLGTCFPVTIRVLLEAAADLGLEGGLETAAVGWLARSDECSKLIEQLQVQ